MKKISFKTILISVAAAALALVFATQVSAMTPTLSLTNTGSGLQVTVYGDANASVILDYYSGGQLIGAGIIGYTNYSGYYSGTINSYQVNIPNGAQVVVVVNNQQSGAVTWSTNNYNNGYCYQTYPYNCNNGYTGQVTLSQTNINMTVGQTQNISIYNNGGYAYNYGQYYLSNNTGTGAATATISGNTLTVYGQTTGSATFTVCANSVGYNTSGCATLYVTVTGNYNNTCYYQYAYNCNNNCYQSYPYNCNNTCSYYPYNCNNNYYNNNPLSVSNSNVQVTVGNTGTVTIYGNNYGYGYGGYYVTSNNSSIASVTVTGSTVSIYGISAGSTSVSVCAAGGNQCATIYVTVTAPVYTYPGGYNGQYYYGNQYNYPPYPGNWNWSYNQNCWIRY